MARASSPVSRGGLGFLFIRAIGKVLHDDPDMWPFEALQKELNEVVPDVVREVVQGMGYNPTDGDVQAILDEIALYQRSRGHQHLNGRGQASEILRHVHHILADPDNAMRDDGGVSPLLPVLADLQDTFTMVVERERGGLFMTHDSAQSCPSIIKVLLDIKAEMRGNPRVNLRDPTLKDTVEQWQWLLSTRLWRFRGMSHKQCSCFRGGYLDSDEAALDFWKRVLGVSTSAPVDLIVKAWDGFVFQGAMPPWLRTLLTALLDICEDGIGTLWSFHRVLRIVGPFPDVPALLAELGRTKAFVTSGFKVQDRLERDGDYVAIPNRDDAGLTVHWLAHGAVREVSVTRGSGVWTEGGVPYETLSDLFEGNGRVWRRAVGDDFGVPGGCGADDEGTALLHRGCVANNVGMVALSLHRGGRLVVNQCTWGAAGGFTPLALAVRNPIGNPAEVVRMLLDAGADPNATDPLDQSVVFGAVVSGRAEAVALLRESGARAEPPSIGIGPSYLTPYETNYALQGYRPHPAVMKEILLFHNTTDHLPALRALHKELLRKISGGGPPEWYRPMGFDPKLTRANGEAIRTHSETFRDELVSVLQVVEGHLLILEACEAVQLQ